MQTLREHILTLILIFICAIVLTLAGSPSFGAGCLDALEAGTIINVETLDPETKAVYDSYTELTTQGSLDRIVTRDVFLRLISDDNTFMYRRAFGEILTRVKTLKEAGSTEPVSTLFRSELKDYLKGKVPENEIKKRVQALNPNAPESLRQALGSMTLEETHHWAYGGDIKQISPDSLIGKYIAETGAKTAIRKLHYKTDKNVKSPERLIVLISQATLESFNRHLGAPFWMSVLGHAQVLFGGEVYPYAGQKSAFRLPRVDTPLPMVLMNSTEAHRFGRYFTAQQMPAYAGSYTTMLKQPWQIPGYTATGGYTCCTHWIGNIPIGDTRVDSYTFPGRQEAGQQYVNGAWVNAPGGEGPRTQRLVPYKGQPDIIRELWRVPGHQQFSGVLGLAAENNMGNFASPGWVIQSLYTRAPKDRVPIVFLVVNDATADVPAELPELNHEAPR